MQARIFLEARGALNPPLPKPSNRESMEPSASSSESRGALARVIVDCRGRCASDRSSGADVLGGIGDGRRW